MRRRSENSASLFARAHQEDPAAGRAAQPAELTGQQELAEQGIRRYLGSGLIKGIGPVMAERMVNHFGVDIMHIIDDEPGRLIEVPGLGPKRSTRIKVRQLEASAFGTLARAAAGYRALCREFAGRGALAAGCVTPGTRPST